MVVIKPFIVEGVNFKGYSIFTVDKVYLSDGQKSKDSCVSLAVIRKVYYRFSETQPFIEKAYREKCCKENI